MQAGALDRRCAFHRLDGVTDDYGGTSTGFEASPFLVVWGKFDDRPGGRERVEGAALSAMADAVLVIRDSAAAREVTAADRVVVDGIAWQIRAVGTSMRRRGFIEMRIEKGVA